MKRKIGIGLLIIFNLVFIFAIKIITVLGFGILVVPLGAEINEVTNFILIHIALLLIIMFSINYFLTKEIIVSKKPFLTSLIPTAIGIILSIAVLLSTRQSFLDF